MNLGPTDAARIALACLDLTSLNDRDTEADVVRLCERAQTPHGPVAAVCVWPRFAARARRELPSGIALAAVANFPHGGADLEDALADTRAVVDAGAQEVDVVLPYEALRSGDDATASTLLRTVRDASRGLALKVILETGVLVDSALVARAAAIALDAGADFLKTSTGRTPVGATPEAVHTMIEAIERVPRAAGRVGLKVSGGVRTVADAARHMAIVEASFGREGLVPRRFRIGASSLLGDIEAVLGGGASSDAAPGGY